MRAEGQPASERDALGSRRAGKLAGRRRGPARFPIELFERADSLRSELLASVDRSVLLHGDLHHFNILRSDCSGWLAIDPKGLAGDRYFDICQFLLNPRAVPARVNRRRLDVFCAELDLDPVRTRQWCLVARGPERVLELRRGRQVRVMGRLRGADAVLLKPRICRVAAHVQTVLASDRAGVGHDLNPPEPR
ncbi:MAG: hypothetical protein JOZ81_02285 [Chloroflexi bacterium]|nr:hypothetical protein [Chloroflexota bacterium]